MPGVSSSGDERFQPAMELGTLERLNLGGPLGGERLFQRAQLLGADQALDGADARGRRGGDGLWPARRPPASSSASSFTSSTNPSSQARAAVKRLAGDEKPEGLPQSQPGGAG